MVLPAARGSANFTSHRPIAFVVRALIIRAMVYARDSNKEKVAKGKRADPVNGRERPRGRRELPFEQFSTFVRQASCDGVGRGEKEREVVSRTRGGDINEA